MRLNLGWRLLVFLELLVLVLIAGLAVLLVLRNPVMALLAVPTAGLLAYGSWRYMSASGARRRPATIILAAGLAAAAVELLVFVRDSRNVRLALLMALLLTAYLAVMAALRRKYWHELRVGGSASHVPPAFRQPFLIINPKSGSGRAVKAHVDQLAEAQGIRVLMLQPGDDVETLARQAVAEGADVLGISGGDGSIGAVAKVALESDLPVVVLPGGTRCHFARDIGLDPMRIADALAGFSGVERRIDIGDINGRLFLNNVSFGLYADIVRHPGYRQNKLRVSRQVLQSLASGRKPPYSLRFSHEGQRFEQAVMVLVGVNAYQTLSIMELGQRQRLDGGILQVTVIARLDDMVVRRLIHSLSLNRVHAGQLAPHVYQWESVSFQIASRDGSVTAGVDGECEEYASPVRVNVLPGALRVFVPAEGVRSRPKGSLSAPVIRQLWRSAIGRP